MRLTPHATWASLASAHRVHAGYAKNERFNSTCSIWLWSLGTAAFIYLAVTDPGIEKIILLIIGGIGITGAIYFRHEAKKRYKRHVIEADKYQMLAEATRRYSMDKR